MEELLARFWDELVGRRSGPLHFRLVLQPLMAALLAIRDGLRDAREGRAAYLWAVVTRRGERALLLREGWKAGVKIFLLAVVLDVIYQVLVLHVLRPLETVVVATALSFLPYALLRGPVNRIARLGRRRG